MATFTRFRLVFNIEKKYVINAGNSDCRRKPNAYICLGYWQASQGNTLPFYDAEENVICRMKYGKRVLIMDSDDLKKATAKAQAQ